jgi:light-regulated signal transduction histidine kinase (bacteriophytochrome)
MASYLNLRERSAIAECVVAVRHLEAELLALADDDRDYRDWLAPLVPALFRMTKSQGLVICDDTVVWTAGQVPTEQQVAALIDWVRSSGEDRIVTDRLAARFPSANLHCAVASGMSASKIANGWLIWFRTEWEHELTWAGEPGKLIKPAEDQPAADKPAGDIPAGDEGRIGPRKSFAAWCEQIRGQSRPWTASDIFVVGQVHMLVLRAMMDDRVRQDFQRRKFEMAGRLAHELNSLLQPIVSMAQMALEDHRADAELTEEMTVILDSANRAAEIVRGTLLYVRPPRKERRHVSLADVVAGELDLLRRTLPPGIRLHLHTDPSNGKCRIPPVELGQIVRNLVANAVHALGGDGEVTVNVDEVHVTDAQAVLMQIPPVRYGRILVSDNGPGIAPALLDQIFEPFFTTKGIGQGTGLGLSIVQGLVRSRAGTINVRNRPEGGAVFEIMLPAFDAPVGTAGDRRADAPERRGDRRQGDRRRGDRRQGDT